jgi:toxin FitB
MIVLDTNVVSEAMKPMPDAKVKAWLNSQVTYTLHITTVTLAELLFGIGVLPGGKRQDLLNQALDGLMRLFTGRVLAFDEAAARQYAALAVAARTAGQGFPTPNGYIAAIAAARGMIVASRDVAPFSAAGLTVIDPWNADGAKK